MEWKFKEVLWKCINYDCVEVKSTKGKFSFMSMFVLLSLSSEKFLIRRATSKMLEVQYICQMEARFHDEVTWIINEVDRW